MIGFFTDKGNIRELNEDYLGYCIENEFQLYIIGDGMGGHNAGEVASKMAVDGIITYVKENYNLIPLGEILERAIQDINLDIYRFALRREGLAGMGTTITAIFVCNDKIQIANVGDSCCFGINDRGIKKITKDHSLVQELVDSGCITEEEAKKHPRRNLITRAIGTNIRVDVDIFKVNKEDYKFFILCTDGLTNDLDEQEIWQAIITSEDLSKACEELVNVVKRRGGRDNITVLVFGGDNKYDR